MRKSNGVTYSLTKFGEFYSTAFIDALKHKNNNF